MSNAHTILADIKGGNIKPIYFLMGEEPYFIDQISDFIEETVLTEDEKGFNQVVMYGRDSSVEGIIENAKRFPMMCEKQVVIVKEAQDLSKTIEQLEEYAEHPQPSTVLVLCYKYKTLDKRKKLYKTLQKNGIVFESKKLYENRIASWIKNRLNEQQYQIEPKATLMLVEFLGTDLSRIDNELNKLQSILPKQTTISPIDIEKNIGISKDFNNFELTKAIGVKEVVKANRIINYFAQNPKSNPLVMTLSLLHMFFTKLLIYHSLKDKSTSNIVKFLKINPYFASDYVTAAKNYPMRKVSEVIDLLHKADVRSKGVGGTTSHSEILKELLFKIIH